MNLIQGQFPDFFFSKLKLKKKKKSGGGRKNQGGRG
jgi:hypothetical protein